MGRVKGAGCLWRPSPFIASIASGHSWVESTGKEESLPWGVGFSFSLSQTGGCPVWDNSIVEHQEQSWIGIG